MHPWTIIFIKYSNRVLKAHWPVRDYCLSLNKPAYYNTKAEASVLLKFLLLAKK